MTWTNADGTAHTVTSTESRFDSGNVEQATIYSRAFSELGTNDHFCTIHPYMKGSIEVVLPYGKG